MLGLEVTSWFAVLLLSGVLLAFLIVALTLTGFLLGLLGRVIALPFGVVSDLFATVGCLLGLVVATPLAICNLVLGRWQAANGHARTFGDCACGLLRHPLNAILVRPLRVLKLDSAAAAVAGALPGAVVATAASTAVPEDAAGRHDTDRPRFAPDGSMVFPGFSIERELKGGGSGARLFVARPEPGRRARLDGQPAEVVIKSFRVDGGSTLPAIVRESRALESARTLGLVLEHHLDEQHFWYVMPYHHGTSLTRVVEDVHRADPTPGLRGEALERLVGHVRDLMVTLVHFHDSGLWHKDVKPDNIIVHDDRAHLVDLGLVSSLKSSLTLTTHGTEYFRDPELVRMALRGVKVHEVDGSKFDIYGAGAVLYYVLQNDFPAQGGLSDFAHPVPDALSWIVRRAMADYGKRYRSSREMLADLDTVLAAADPWSVRPADLPSMQEDAVGAAVPPPPPYARTVRQRAVPPPAVSRSPRSRVRRTGPVRPPVPTDRPSGMLAVLGVLTLLAATWLVVSQLLPDRERSIADGGARESLVSRSLGPEVTTVTLVSPERSERILLVRGERDHSERPGLGAAADSVLAWFESNGYLVDHRPDLGCVEAVLELESDSPPAFGRTLTSHGYAGIARVVVDEDGAFRMRLITDSDQLWLLELDGDLESVRPWTPRNGGAPEHGTLRTISLVDLDGSAGVSCPFSAPTESIAWTPTPEPGCAPSWTTASSPHPVPTTHWSRGPLRMRAFLPPTSRVERPRTSLATRMSA